MRTHQIIPERGPGGPLLAPLPRTLAATGGVLASTAGPDVAACAGFLAAAAQPRTGQPQRGAVNPHGSAPLFAMKLILLLAVLPAVAFAADNVAEPVAVAPDLATSLIQSLAARHPWLASVLAFIGTMRLVAKPVCMWLERRALATPDKADDLFIARARRTTAVRVLDFFLDLGFSVKRDTVARAVRKPKAAALLALCAVLSGAGCASLTPNQQAVLKAVAKAAVVFGINQLGDSVKEVRPFQPALLGVINATFAATDNAASLGDALTEGIKTVVADEALRAQVIAAVRQQLRGATAASSGDLQSPLGHDPQARFNAALAARL